ncbi:hypothetical protein [Nocardia bovistercoris]|uniref:Uncharacterized protein n=1 Tax=Nocardia bovistercoris TaxID=2785916 RepID=A0A931N692_9NOCA|nr:hypothetical protein [Nocardia bovistercoris]MBH0780517.1 hypothetical protein [Nocardia bovistercoris]
MRRLVENLREAEYLETRQQALRDAITAHTRDITAAHHTGNPLEVERLRRTHAALSEELTTLRDLDRAVAHDYHRALGFSVEDAALVVEYDQPGRDATRADMVAGVEAIGTEVRRQDWTRELDPHNERIDELTRQRVHEISARVASPRVRESEIGSARDSAEKLRLDPAAATEQHLDIEKFRAVREGVKVGYDPATRTHIFQRDGADPIAVAHDDRERRMGEDARRVDAGMDLERIEAEHLVELGHAHAVEEAARARLQDAPRASALTHEHSLDRGLHRDR